MKQNKYERPAAFAAVIIFISLLSASCQSELIPEPEMDKIQSSSGGMNVSIEPPFTVEASHGKTKKITVSWSTSNGAAQYLIYSAESPHSEFVQIAETKGEASSIDIQEPAGTSAYYKVRAKSYEGTLSSFSDVVFGSTMATPIISNITSNTDGSASTVTWWMENCSQSTYRDSVNYIVYCYDESGKEVAHATASGAETSAVLSELTAKTRYIYQVEAFVKADQSNPELSDKVDEETARRLIPDAPEKLSAEKGMSIDTVRICWTLPQFCDVAVSGGVYERHPLYFTVERKLKDEDDSKYEEIVSYLGTEKKSGTSVIQFSCNEDDMADINSADIVSVQLPPQSDADAERQADYPGYVSRSVITYYDKTAGRGKQYVYRVQSYVDDVKRTVSAETAAATAEGFLLSKPTFSASAVYNYQKDESGKNTDTITSIRVSFKTTFEAFGQNYSYLLYRNFTPMTLEDGTPTGEAGDKLLVKAGSSTTLNTETDLFDFAAADKNFNIGYYRYTLYICAPGESEVTNAYDSITTGGKITVIDDASKLPSITMFQIKDGYADHFNIKWNYDENCQYKLEWKSSDDNFEKPHSLELQDGDYTVQDGTAEYNHKAKSGEGRIYTITAYMGIEVSRTYPLSEGDETREPEKLYTLGTVSPRTDDIGYRTISVSWEPAVRADGTYTVQAYYESDADRANELAARKYEIQETDGTYSCTITEPDGFDDPACSGLPIIMEITARNTGTGETTVARHTVRTLGPAAVNASTNVMPESDFITVTWNKAEGAAGYLIRRYSYADNSCTAVERAVTYWCTSDGGELEVLGDLDTNPNAGGTRATIKTGDKGTIVLTDSYAEPTTAESAYQINQSKLSWGRPYGYIVLPVKESGDFTFSDDSATLSADSAVDYTADGRTLSEAIGSTLGYGLNLVAAKAESGTTQGLQWDKPYNAQSPVVYRRLAGTTGKFTILDAGSTTVNNDNTAAVTIDGTSVVGTDSVDNCYLAFEYIVRYYPEKADNIDKDFDLPPSLLEEIEKNTDSYDTPAGEFTEQKNKGYLLALSGFNARVHPAKTYYEQVYWNPWNYKERAVGPDKMEVYVQNNNISAVPELLLTVEKTRANDGITINGADIKAEAEAQNQICVAPAGIVATGSDKKGTTDGLLKVLRDYKHNYTFKLSRTAKEGDEPIRVGNSEYETDYIKTAYRQITDEELVKATMLILAAMEHDSDSQSHTSGGDFSLKGASGAFNGSGSWSSSMTWHLNQYIHNWKKLPSGDTNVPAFLKLNDQEGTKGRKFSKYFVHLSTDGGSSFKIDKPISITVSSEIYGTKTINVASSADQFKATVDSSVSYTANGLENCRYWMPMEWYKSGGAGSQSSYGYFGENQTYGWWPSSN